MVKIIFENSKFSRLKIACKKWSISYGSYVCLWGRKFARFRKRFWTVKISNFQKLLIIRFLRLRRTFYVWNQNFQKYWKQKFYRSNESSFSSDFDLVIFDIFSCALFWIVLTLPAVSFRVFFKPLRSDCLHFDPFLNSSVSKL